MLTALSQINIELTSRCQKSCFFCGHQNKKVNTGLEYGDIDEDLLIKIAFELPEGIIVQFHRDGEPLLYPKLDPALNLFACQIRSIVTNGKLLVKKAGIIDNCETLTVSAFDNDPDGPEQLEILREFLRIKGERKPNVNVKIVGLMAPQRLAQYEELGVAILHRSLHHPAGDYSYRISQPPIPEAGVCLDFLSHPSVDWAGNLYVCNRLDANNHGYLGNLKDSSLESLWNSPRRLEMMKHHIAGRRDLANALCAKCEFYGLPTNG